MFEKSQINLACWGITDKSPSKDEVAVDPDPPSADCQFGTSDVRFYLR